jgi:hypothetical protein
MLRGSTRIEWGLE